VVKVAQKSQPAGLRPSEKNCPCLPGDPPGHRVRWTVRYANEAPSEIKGKGQPKLGKKKNSGTKDPVGTNQLLQKIKENEKDQRTCKSGEGEQRDPLDRVKREREVIKG